MAIYFFAISRIRNLVGLRGILSLINTDGWNAAMDPSELNSPDPSVSPPLEGSGNQTISRGCTSSVFTPFPEILYITNYTVIIITNLLQWFFSWNSSILYGCPIAYLSLFYSSL